MGMGARAGFHAWNPMSISAPGRSGTPGITISELPTLGQGTGRAWPGKGAGVPYHGVSHCGPRPALAICSQWTWGFSDLGGLSRWHPWGVGWAPGVGPGQPCVLRKEGRAPAPRA